MNNRPLKVFLCHSSEDKRAVRDLYFRLRSASVYIIPWLDKESLLPGENWEYEISLAVRSSDIVLVCLSQTSARKVGFVQKEIKDALDVADRQPEGTIFLIPVKLEECEMPNRLGHLHYVNLFEKEGFDKLMRSLRSRAEQLGIKVTEESKLSNYSPEERRELITRIIAEELGVEEEEVTPETTLEELGGDGFDAINIEMKLEDEYGIILTDEDADGFPIVDDVRYLRPGIGA